MASNDCNICFDSSAKISCKNCEFQTCKDCSKQFLETSINDAACCSCKHPWDDDFLINSFGTSWFNGKYRKTRTEVIVDRQKSMMATTMPLVEQERNKRKRLQTIQEMEAEYKLLRERQAELKRAISHLKYGGEAASVQNVPRNVARYRCATPECKGFVSSEDSKCPVCDHTTCTKCLCIEESEHECKQEDLDTANEIKKATVSCPGCHVRIQRSHGCNQMFCVNCHVAFDYKTLEIVRGNIHNPHYFEIQAQLNRGHVQRDARDVPCGGFPNVHHMGNLDRADRLRHGARLRIFHHITNVELPKLRENPDFNAQNRVKYIMREMDDKAFVTATSRKAMDEKVNSHYQDILRAFVDSSQDVYMRMMDSMGKHTSTIEPFRDLNYVKELDTIIAYTNKESKKIGEKYKRAYFVVPVNYYTEMYRNDDFCWKSRAAEKKAAQA